MRVGKQCFGAGMYGLQAAAGMLYLIHFYAVFADLGVLVFEIHRLVMSCRGAYSSYITFGVSCWLLDLGCHLTVIGAEGDRGC